MAEKLTIEQLVEFIQKRVETGQGGVTFVAIDGPSGAGKTTIADALQQSDLAATVIHIDDFYSDEGVNPLGGLTPEEACDEYVDWQRLQELVIEPLKDGDAGYYPVYDWVARKPGEWVTLQPKGVLVIEGVYAMRLEIRGSYDVTVYVDTPAETRLGRLSERSDNPVWVKRWAQAEEWYNENIRPADYADVMVSGF